MKYIRELISLEQRVALITGGAGYIGKAIAETLAELGANLILIDTNKHECSKISEKIQQNYRTQVTPITFDLSDKEKLYLLKGKIKQNYKKLDILINCAAFVATSDLTGWTTSFENQSSNAWLQAMDVNLYAPFALSQILYPLMKESGHASIVNVSSIYGLVGPDMRLYEGTSMGNPAAYSASKGGLLQLTRWLATVLAPDIRVNAITPGGVWRNQPDIFCKKYINKTPLRRMATEEDIKGAAAYLASDLSSYVTGQNIVVDGGWTAW